MEQLTTNDLKKEEKIKREVKERYAAAIQSGGGCCGKTSETFLPVDRVVSVAGYRPDELVVLPPEAVSGSFGCGNPVAFAEVLTGQVVLDIGCGAGIDCFLAAPKVGPEGRVIGLDMTPAMIEKATGNARNAGFANVEFRLGEAENMPLPDGTVDWIISNCVLNLSPNKPRAFREAFRVLRTGGRFSISDIMVESLPWLLRRSTALYTSCVAGAIPETHYLQELRNAGFSDVHVTDRIVYDRDQILSFLQDAPFLSKVMRQRAILKLLDRSVVGKIWSARVVGRKERSDAV